MTILILAVGAFLVLLLADAIQFKKAMRRMSTQVAARARLSR